MKRSEEKRERGGTTWDESPDTRWTKVKNTHTQKHKQTKRNEKDFKDTHRKAKCPTTQSPV